MPGETITLYLLNGDPQGLRIATVANWDGKTFAAPRANVKELLNRPEMDWPGVYILEEQDEKTGEPTTYIGVAKSIRNRLPGHQKKDWRHVIVFVSQSLHEGNIKHLEGCLLDEAKKIGSRKITNDKSSGSPLQEHERANMDAFFGRIRLLLPIMGSDILVPKAKAAKGKALICKIKGLVAHGNRSTKGGFVVFKGSEAVLMARKSSAETQNWVFVKREELKQSKILIAEPDRLRFAEDCEFTSPSAAAGVIRGGNANGMTEWKSEDGKPLKDIEALT